MANEHTNRVSGPNVLPEDPDPADYGMVVRPIPGTASGWDTAQVAVGVAAVQVAASPLTNRKAISLRASCDTDEQIFIGKDANVLITTGSGLMDRETVSIDLGPDQQIWAIASAANQLLFVIEVG